MDPSVESGKGADGEELGPPSNKCTKARQAFRRMQIIIKKDQKHLLQNITIVPPLKKIIYIIIKNTSMRRGRHKSLVSASQSESEIHRPNRSRAMPILSQEVIERRKKNPSAAAASVDLSPNQPQHSKDPFAC